MTNENQMLAKFENLSMNDTIDGALAKSMYVGDYWEPSYRYWYPSTTIFQTHKDTFAQAFKIVSMMIEKGYLDKITLKKFITLVKEVEAEL